MVELQLLGMMLANPAWDNLILTAGIVGVIVRRDRAYALALQKLETKVEALTFEVRYMMERFRG